MSALGTTVQAMDKNQLHYADNILVLRGLPDETVDLVYLDPPFNSNRDYSVLFSNDDGVESEAQAAAFEDTWRWNAEAANQYEELLSGDYPSGVANAMEAMGTLLGRNDVLAYLTMMAPRLVELRRVLKPTGSLYLHCDPTVSHYLKVILDAIFGPAMFRNELVWRRSNAHNSTTKKYGPIHDVIFFYTKSNTYPFHPGRRPYAKAYIEDRFKFSDERGRYQKNYLTGPGIVKGGQSGQEWRGYSPASAGRHWAIPASLVQFLPDNWREMSSHEKLEALYEKGLIEFPKKEGGQPMYKQYIGPGVPYQDIWAYQPNTRGVLFNSDEHIDQDVKWLENEEEKLGYETQKPVGLLKRIIEASTSEGDVVLDPFCGCGTTVDAAEEMNRRWIGIDISYLAVDLIHNRLLDKYGSRLAPVEVRGIPRDLAGARALHQFNEFEFERWAVSLVGGQPNDKQVGDGGSDGIIRFRLDKKRRGRAVVSVKGGQNIDPSMVLSLVGAVQTFRAEMGVLILMREPTAGMKRAAVEAGEYLWEWNQERFPTIQIITVAELLAGKLPKLPPRLRPYTKAAPLDEGAELSFDL